MELLLEQEKVVIGQTGEASKYKKIRADFIPYNDLWTGVDFLMSKRKTWMTAPLTSIDPSEVDQVIKTSRRTIKRLGRELSGTDIVHKVLPSMESDVTFLEGQLPIIEVLCSHDIRTRHWI